MPRFDLILERNVTEVATFKADSLEEAQEMLKDESVFECGDLEFEEVVGEIINSYVEIHHEPE